MDKNKMSKQELIELSDKLYEDEKYDQTIELLDDDILARHNSEVLYTNRAKAYWRNNELDNALLDCEAALNINKEYAPAYNYIGNCWFDKNKYDIAIKNFSKAIKIDHKYVIPYYNIGVILYTTGKLEEAIKEFDRAINVDPMFSPAYNNRGVALERLGEHKKALDNFNKAIKTYSAKHRPFSKLGMSYFNRGLRSFHSGDYETAIKDFEVASQLSPENLQYPNWVNLSKEKRDEEKALKQETIERDDSNTSAPIQLFLRILDDANISELDKSIIMQISVEAKRKGIDKIRCHAAQDIKKIIPDNLVAHYTKLKVADIIISAKEEESYHRFYNAVYMNDPEEGRVLLQYMDKEIRDCFEEASKEEEDNIYIGSFLPANNNNEGHEDELVMWRTYGKDIHQNEAAGCSIVLDADFFDSFDDKEAGDTINPDMQTSSIKKKAASSSQCLYRVLYYDKRNTDKEFDCIYENGGALKKDVDTLKEYLNKLIQQKDKSVNSDKNKAIDKIIYHLLSEVRYFFKSADYSFENEVRVIQFATKGSPLLKIDEHTTPKRVYLNSNNNVHPYIRKVILGPKVPNPKQWLYLEVAMKQKRDIKKEGYSISVIQSQRKYQ